jgi:hypothetical protein
VAMIKYGLPKTPAAVIGGLLSLGDPRVCELIDPLRSSLSVPDVVIVTHCYSGFASGAAVRFYVDWLSELIERRDEEGESLFGNVAAGLHRIARARRTPFFFEGLRPFPVPTDPDEGWRDAKQVAPEDFARIIAGDLHSLERQEAPPRVMPLVIRAFGLKPRTPEDEVASIQ